VRRMSQRHALGKSTGVGMEAVRVVTNNGLLVKRETMFIRMSAQANVEESVRVVERVREWGFNPFLARTRKGRVIVATGKGRVGELDTLRIEPGVESVEPFACPYPLASRQLKDERSVVEVGGVPIGGPEVVVIAGPCSVESPEQLFRTARAVKASGAHLLRGGAFKPRTSPYDFQGLGVEGLRLLKEASRETGLPVVTEVMGTEEVDDVAEYADMLQVGARNMQNFTLLRRLASTPRPILLKRGPSAHIKEWLLAAEYLLSGGNQNVILCERGIKTFETELRNTLDLAAVALVRELSHLPVIVDPSHATGRRSLISATSRAAIAVGTDGLLIEVHPEPERALSDGPQSLDLDGFERLMRDVCEPLRAVAGTMALNY
jgi:3-deoxy-7-phosphoheptulonate synthase